MAQLGGGVPENVHAAWGQLRLPEIAAKVQIKPVPAYWLLKQPVIFAHQSEGLHFQASQAGTRRGRIIRARADKGKAEMWPGFEPDDFLAFEQPDVYSRIEYVKKHLHPRLRALGEEIRKSFHAVKATDLRCQLRSGRWYKTPLWTHVSLVAPEEQRSDIKRPRLLVYIDGKRVIAGFCHTLWSPEWKRLCRDEPSLLRVMDSVVRSGELQVGILHRTESGSGEILPFSKSNDALLAAAQVRQDFLFVGRVYPWPDERELLCSPSFLSPAQDAMLSAWPVYEYAFYIAPMVKTPRWA